MCSRFSFYILKRLLKARTLFVQGFLRWSGTPVDINVVTINQNTFTVLEISNFTILDEKIS